MKTQTIPNLETLLPKRDQYEDTLAKDNLAFYDCIFSYIDQSKWEDRFAMMLRIARNTPLKDDPRPSCHQVQTHIKDMLNGERGHILTAPYDKELLIEDIAWECNLREKNLMEKCRGEISNLIDNWKDGVPLSQQIDSMFLVSRLYRTGYPKSLVTPTPIGSLIAEKICSLKAHINKQVLDHQRAKMDSLMLSLDHLQAKTVGHINNGEELFLHKGDIDWKEIAIARITIDDYDWYSRNYENTSVLEDWYSNPFGIHFYPTFQMDYILYKICQLYGVQLSDYVSESSRYYTHLWLFNENFCQENEDYFFSLTDIFSECFKHWKEKHPLLA